MNTATNAGEKLPYSPPEILTSETFEQVAFQCGLQLEAGECGGTVLTGWP